MLDSVLRTDPNMELTSICKGSAMTKTPFLVLLILMCISTSVLSDIYKCTANGKLTFSQRPCEGNQQQSKVTIEPNNSSTYNSPKPSSLTSKSLDTSLYVAIESIDRKMKKSEQKIKSYKKSMMSALKDLEVAAQLSTDSLTLTYNSAQHEKMRAIISEFKLLTRKETNHLKSLIQEKRQLVTQRQRHLEKNNTPAIRY